MFIAIMNIPLKILCTPFSRYLRLAAGTAYTQIHHFFTHPCVHHNANVPPPFLPGALTTPAHTPFSLPSARQGLSAAKVWSLSGQLSCHGAASLPPGWPCHSQKPAQLLCGAASLLPG